VSDVVIAVVCAVSLVVHIASTLIAVYRCRPPRQHLPPPADAPKVTILRPVCGVDAFEAQTLRATFALDYPRVQVIFCCERPSDPAARLVRTLLRTFATADARLLIGRTPRTQNPKLNNLLKAWAEIDADWVIMADSNVALPRDYVQRLLGAWTERTGVLCAPPIGSMPAGFWAELECAFLNGYQARWQYTADTLGWGFAQGKTMMFRRRDLVAAGGLLALGSELAEDAAATKLVRAMGLRAELADAAFPQPLGTRAMRQVWDRQARWARLRRRTFPGLFLLELLSTSLVPLASAAILAQHLHASAAAAAMAVLAVWHGSEMLLARGAGWHLSWRSPFAALVRDALLPALWMQAWLGSSFTWRGNQILPDRTLSQPG
jgi:ceramide glucosyltransferase